MIKKNGWNEREKEGANIVYEKDGHFINLAVATDYIAVTKYTKILPNMTQNSGTFPWRQRTEKNIISLP